MKRDLILIGGGGHALSCLEALTDHGSLAVSGFIDVSPDVEVAKHGIAWLGDDEILSDGDWRGTCFHIAVGQITSPKKRQQLFASTRNMGGIFPTILSKAATVSKHAVLGEGVLVMPRGFVNHSARIGDNSIVNSGAIIEHGAIIGAHCYIAPGAIILGEAVVQEGTVIGAGSIVREGITVSSGSVIGAGERVMHDV